MAMETASGGKRIAMMQYGPTWRKLRQIMHKLLMPKTSHSYRPIELIEAQQLSIDLMDDPDHFLMHHRRYACSTMFNITYGRRLPSWDCQEMKDVIQVIEGFASIQNPGQWLVDVFNSLEYLPGFLVQNWRKVGHQLHAHEKKLWMGLWNQLKADVADGTAPSCFARDFLDSEWKDQGIDELQAAYINGTMIEGMFPSNFTNEIAGTDTSAVTLNCLMCQLALHPEVVARAQEELDRVVGKRRTPTWDDEPNLPYIRAIIKEIMRYRPITKSGQLHMLTQDDEYQGYFIPKDCIVMISWWAIHFDPKRYPDPYKFKPERFLNHKLSAAEYTAMADVSQRDHFGYGAGRRM
jgi:cytochrome P450